ncbi:cyclin-like protein [Mycena galericulata]|nr:cyclin-like protein [Mycena galericulata]
MSRGQSPGPHSSSKYHHPYFTPAEVDYLSEKQRGKLSVTQEERVRQNACAFLEGLGARIGFPRRTIATAQNLYNRFHLFFPRKDFSYVDVSLASLYVSTKMHDTLKKPRELLAVSYAIRFPDLVAKSKHPGGEIDLDAMDQQVVERDRQRLLAIERLLLETICFQFYIADAVSLPTAHLYRYNSRHTLWPLAGLYVAALLSSFGQPITQEESGTRTAHEIAEILGKNGDWERKYQAQVDDLEGIAHTVIDLLIQGAQSQTVNTSPRTPSSPSPHPSPRTPHPLTEPQLPSIPYSADQLIRLKIVMRQTEHTPRTRQPLGTADP